MASTDYIIQKVSRSHCGKCGGSVDLLSPRDIGPVPDVTRPWFYICWKCHHVAQVGKCPVERE